MTRYAGCRRECQVFCGFWLCVRSSTDHRLSSPRYLYVDLSRFIDFNLDPDVQDNSCMHSSLVPMHVQGYVYVNLRPKYGLTPDHPINHALHQFWLFELDLKSVTSGSMGCRDLPSDFHARLQSFDNPLLPCAIRLEGDLAEIVMRIDGTLRVARSGVSTSIVQYSSRDWSRWDTYPSEVPLPRTNSIW
jgi:hypothetical protein